MELSPCSASDGSCAANQASDSVTTGNATFSTKPGAEGLDISPRGKKATVERMGDKAEVTVDVGSLRAGKLKLRLGYFIARLHLIVLLARDKSRVK